MTRVKKGAAAWEVGQSACPRKGLLHRRGLRTYLEHLYECHIQMQVGQITADHAPAVQKTNGNHGFDVQALGHVDIVATVE